MPLTDLARGSEALVRVGRRHADVDHGDVRLVHRDVAEQVLRRSGLRDDLEAGLLEQPGDALAQQHRVVREHDAARVAELRDGAAQRREVARKPVGDHLVDALGIGKALQAVGAEIARLDAGDERRRGGGEQHLAAVPRGRDARGADHVETGVALLAELRHAGVESHPHLDDGAVRPAVVADPCLAGERRSQRRLDLAEHCRELVAGRVDLGARRLRRDLLAQQAPHVRDQARRRRRRCSGRAASTPRRRRRGT